MAGEQQILVVTYIASTPATLWDALTNPDVTQRYWFQTRIEKECMWTCPKCGRPFTRPHHSHSCVRASVDDFLRDKTPEQVDLYYRFEAKALAVGNVNLAPAKSRIGFQHGRIFAAANALSRNGLRVHIVTGTPIVSTRIKRVEEMTPDCYVNHILLRTENEIDEEVVEWLRRGYQWS